MMRNRPPRAGWVLALLLVLMSGGCVDAAREGFTGGVEAGISSIVQSFFEQALDSAQD